MTKCACLLQLCLAASLLAEVCMYDSPLLQVYRIVPVCILSTQVPGMGGYWSGHLVTDRQGIRWGRVEFR